MSGRRCSVICKDKKELMVPFYLSQLLQAFVLYFFPMSVMGLLVLWLRETGEQTATGTIDE